MPAMNKVKATMPNAKEVSAKLGGAFEIVGFSSARTSLKLD